MMGKGAGDGAEESEQHFAARDGGADRSLHGEAAPQGVEADRQLQAGERRPQAVALDEFVERGGEFGVIGGLGGVVARGEVAAFAALGVELAELDGEQRPFGRLRQLGEALGYATQRGVEGGRLRWRRSARAGPGFPSPMCRAISSSSRSSLLSKFE